MIDMIEIKSGGNTFVVDSGALGSDRTLEKNIVKGILDNFTTNHLSVRAALEILQNCASALTQIKM